MAFLLSIITPKGIYLENEIDSLSIKLTSGYRTFLKGHIPLIGVLEIAPMHFIKDGKTYFYAVHGGVINVTKEKISIIVNAIEAKHEIDIDRAIAAKKRAEDRLKLNNPNLDVKRAKIALLKALNRIKTFES